MHKSEYSRVFNTCRIYLMSSRSLLAAGHGGRGCLSFRREKRVPRGGPSGGDGGHGGSVYLVASLHHNTLVSYRFHPEFQAARGAHGEGSNRQGADGEDLTLEVPVGTEVYEKTPEGDLVRIADLTQPDERVLVARGGRGGLGNAHFATSTNRAPRKTQPGEEGELKELRLQLKLLADVGLVGFPNAGKSTLISRISAARPKTWIEASNFTSFLLVEELAVYILPASICRRGLMTARILLIRTRTRVIDRACNADAALL